MQEYLIQFDGNWSTINEIHKICRDIEIVITIIPVLMIKVNKEQIEEIGKIPGIVTIEENCGGYLCGKEN